MLVEARRYSTHSQSEPGVVHTCERTPVGWACSCLGYFHAGMCKHLGAVERRSEREGWRFGQIAPLATVACSMPLDPAPARRTSQDDAPSVVAVPTADSQSARAARTRAALADLYGDAA